MAYVIDNFNTWKKSQAQIRQLLQIDEIGIRCLPYYGLGHALNDLLYGLKEFWPTRHDLALSTWGCPNLRDAVQSFVRDGVKLKYLENPREISLEDWFAQIPKDPLAVILVRDHCITGQLLIDDEEVKLLNEKRINHIEIQYGWSWSRASLPLPFGVQIRVIDANKVFVVMGNRFRLMPHSASLMDWSECDWGDSVKSCFHHSHEDQLYLENFEKQLSIQSSYFFKINSFYLNTRLYDRAVFIVKDLNGSFFIDNLLKLLNQPPLAKSGFENRCETTNLTRTSGVFPWSWWGKIPLSDSEQRTLVIFSVSFLKEKVNIDKLNSVYLKCLSQVQK